MDRNPLLLLESFGQTIWLDYIQRGLMTSGELQRMIREDGIRGITSNPAIFEKALAEGHDEYDVDIRRLTFEGKSIPDMYETLSICDVQRAADNFHDIYDQTDGRDGYVSLEVDPHLARDTDGTLAEARHLWHRLDRPNVLIKVPATKEGLPAIRQLIAEGINVNATLLFGLLRYREVADAYISGLELRASQGQDIRHVTSVASFFLSRIDTMIDPLLEPLMKGSGRKAVLAGKAIGQVAIASAKMAYKIYKELFQSERFQQLANKGANEQRLLWASTSTKNPNYSDIKYVEELIGTNTINTAPPETISAYRDHGRPENRLERNIDQARDVLHSLPELGIDINRITQQLEEEGIEKFVTPFEKLLCTLDEQCPEVLRAEYDVVTT